MRPAKMRNSTLRLKSEANRELGFAPRSEEGRRIRCEEANEVSEVIEKRREERKREKGQGRRG